MSNGPSVADGEPALKDARFPQFALQIGTPTPRFAALAASLTAAPPPVPEAPSSILRTGKETAMTIISAVPGASGDAYARLVEGLRLEFGCADVGALAARIFDAEKVEFHWEARVQERYLGQHFPLDLDNEDAGEDISRIAILSFLAGRWHAGVCLVDGEGRAVELLWIRSFDGRDDASEAYARVR